MHPLLILDRRQVEELLPMAACIPLMEEALASLAEGRAVQPLRNALWHPDRRGLLGMMPSHLGDGEGGTGHFGIKVVTVFPGNHGPGEDSHQGAVLLFDGANGRPLAMMDGSSITAIRTAAVSAVATRLLAREEASVLALLGAGVQARTHLEALREVCPLSSVRVWSRTLESARHFAAEESERWGVPVEAFDGAREAVAGAHLVCTVTLSQAPVLLGEWLSPGTHINAVGSCTPNARELDATAVARSSLWVDRRESCLAEAGNFLLARGEGAVDEAHIRGEIGDLLVAGARGRQTPEEVTLFESLGLAVEDLAVARFLYSEAQARGIGTQVELA